MDRKLMAEKLMGRRSNRLVKENRRNNLSTWYVLEMFFGKLGFF